LCKRKGLRCTLLLVLLAALLYAGIPTVPCGASSAPDHITLTWTGDPATTESITWRTDLTTALGRVEYVEMGAEKSFPRNAKVVLAQVKALATNLGVRSIHSAMLTGLKPGTRYLYRVGDEYSWSELRTFTTSIANVQQFKFLIFGDSQSTDYNVWHATLQAAYQANPEAAFMINMGDLVDVGQDYAQWNAWFMAARGVIDNIPIMPVVGNHETYTSSGQFSKPKFFTAQFNLPANGPDSLRGQVYSFDYGDVHFSVLDSQEGEEGRFVPAMMEIQQAWLEKDLASSNKRWRVVLIHRPLYNNKLAKADGKMIRGFLGILDKYHVDVVFTAHEHVYARTYPLYGGIAMNSADKGTVYVATGRSGTKTYQDPVVKVGDKFFCNPLDEPNYLVVEVKNDRLMVRNFKKSGALIDDWSIDKPR
jgi:acid phosphatase type 7